MREGLQLGRSLCLLKVLRFGLSSAEPKLVLAELLLGGVAANKSAQKELKELKVTAVGLGGVEKAVDEVWRACLGWWPGAETGFVRCRNVRNKRSKRTKSSGRLAMPWMIRRRGCLPLFCQGAQVRSSSGRVYARPGGALARRFRSQKKSAKRAKSHCCSPGRVKRVSGKYAR
jgi:hypothetical protein